ncbi:GNAT family N-acetyltransferase [Lichenicoccus sp.]|uniref:GNAT family N-acetyltransferase n=1 Tax=Lichenicoccus sp. TaxID=2781899 RepID=UPI003D1154BC
MFDIIKDDLSNERTRELLAIHLAGMHANSPPGAVFALDLSSLQVPGITVWSVWQASDIVGVGALKELRGGSGELKSMRTHPDHLRKGVAAFLLDFMMREARARGLQRLYLETGSGPAFEPALALYRRHGFAEGVPFSDYVKSDFNRFLYVLL